MTAHLPTPPLASKRFLTVVIGVLVLHAALLWAVQANLLQRVADKVIPVVMVVTQRTETAVGPAPLPAVLPKAEITPQLREKKPLVTPVLAPQPKETQAALPVAASATPPAALPLANKNPAPAPNAPTGSQAPQAGAPVTASVPAVAASPVAAAPALAAAPASSSAPSTLPTVDAEHSANEALFRAPPISSRLGEFGSVALMVTVGVSGNATKVSVVKSSGFTRLDNAALEGARKAKYKPATKGGQPVEASYPWTINYTAPTS